MPGPRRLPPAKATPSSPKPNGQSSPGSIGNTPGLITPKPDPNGGIEAGKPTAPTDPPVKPETPKETSFWGKISGAVHGTLDVAGFIPGLGAIPDVLNAGIYALEGDAVNAGMSLVAAVPGAGDAAKAGSMAAKGAKAVAEKAAKEAAEKAAKEAAEKAAKAAERAAKAKAERELAEREAKAAKAEKEAPGGRREDGGNKKGKGKLKCGDSGSYKDLKKKTGDGKFDRDHIPSKAALKERARELNGGRRLTPAQERAVDSWGNAIAIPRQAHIDVSPTYGQTIAEARKDAKNLAGAAKRDVDSMLDKISEYDADGGCREAYMTAAKRVIDMTNDDYARELGNILRTVK